MKNKKIFIALVAATLAFNTASAQIAAKKGITLDEISKQLYEISLKNNDESKLELAKEAKALVESKNEEFVNFGIKIYEYIGNNEAAENATKTLTKRFPKGIQVRQNEFNNVFNDDQASFSVVYKNYNNWLKKFPKNSFGEKSREIYNQALAKMIPLSFQNGEAQKGNEYILQLEESPNSPYYAIGISKALIESNNNQEANNVLEKTYNKVSIDQSRQGKSMLLQVTPMYASVLNNTNQSDKAIVILENLAKTSDLSPESVAVLADAYIKQGNQLDAFIVVSNTIQKTGKNKDLEPKLKSLYKQLNNNKGNYQAYVSDLERQLNEATTAKYKSEMIKKEAPNFSLVNMKGETVSLADLKGKVVVLDFWATWCGPCKVSFPGMQAAVNKYKDDKEVEFLFIDTWQTEKNYKEVVEKFITDNKYTFNVLFDEMKDRPKATTTAYEVKGIPHKVVIDKNGFIRFQSSGGSADVEKIVNEMSTKIELARKG